MAKLINTSSLDSLAKGLDDRAKELVEVEKNRAIAVEGVLETSINDVRNMFDGRSFRYVTQTEYDVLSQEQKDREDIVWCITDAEDIDISLYQTVYDESLETSVKSIPGAINELHVALNNLSGSDHNHNDSYYTKTEIDEGLQNYYTRATIDSIVTQMESEVTASLATKSDTGHAHNDIYYTKTEIDEGLQNYYTSEEVDDLFTAAETDITTALSAKLDTSVATEHFVQTSLVTAPEEVEFEIHSLYKNGTLISPLVNMYSVLNTDGTDLPTYIDYFDQHINSIYASLGDGSQLLTDAKDTVVAAINELQTEINTHNHNDSYYTKTEIDTKSSDLSGAITDEESRAKAEEQALSGRIDTLDANKANATELNSYQRITDDTLATANKTIPNAINELQSKITDEESRAKAEEQALSRSIDTINANKADTTALNNYQLITDNTLDTSNKKIPNAINELKSSIDSNKSDANTKFSNINSSIANIESKNNTQDSEISTLKTNVSNLDTRLGGVTIKQLTQAQYDALATKDANTLYIIIQ